MAEQQHEMASQSSTTEAPAGTGKEGIVYLLTNPAMEGYVKIGMTGGTSVQEVKKRMKQLDSTGVPRAFYCEYAALVENYEKVESALHVAFGDYRVRRNREFFEGIDPFRVKAILKLHEKKDVTPDPADMAKDTGKDEVERPSRAENFKFTMAKVPIGAILEWTDDPNITCEVVDENNRVKYGEKESTISGLAKELKNIPSARGSLYWMYEGETLQERREHFERAEASDDS